MPAKYELAKACFRENVANDADPIANPPAYNLNQGLAGLTAGIEEDLQEVKLLLKKILQELQRRP